MIYKRVFVDSDIILDLLLKREPFYNYSQVLLNKTTDEAITLYTSTLILANIHYIIAKNTSKTLAKEYIKFLTEFIAMLPFDGDNIQAAIASGHIDFEDTIQFYIAKKHKCDLIVSRNIKHYKKFDLPVLTAEQFLRTL